MKKQAPTPQLPYSEAKTKDPITNLTKEEQVIKDVHHMLLDGRPMSALDVIHRYQMYKMSESIKREGQ